MRSNDCRATHEFIQWNNQGADLMRRGKYDQAINHFSRSLEIIQHQIRCSKSIMPTPDQNGIKFIAEHIIVAPPPSPSEQSTSAPDAVGRSNRQSPDNQEDNARSKSPLRTQQLRQHQQQQQLEADSNQDETLNSATANDVFLYREAVRFESAITKLAPLPSAVLRPLSVLVIINTAMAQHLQALETKYDGDDNKPMRRAVFLYEMALKTQSQQLCMQPLGIKGFRLLLSCYNNLGHAHLTLRANRRAQLCFESLLSLLMWTVVQNLQSTISVDGFWSSVFPLIASNPASAAAA